MRSLLIVSAMMSALTMSHAAAAQEAAAQEAATAAASTASAVTDVKRGKSVFSSDGKKIGKVYDVQHGKDGAPVSVNVIYRSKMVYIPTATLSAQDAGYVTSLSLDEVKGK